MQTDAHNKGREERRARAWAAARSSGTPIASPGNRIKRPRQTAWWHRAVRAL